MEGDAGTRQLNPTGGLDGVDPPVDLDAHETSDQPVTVSPAETSDTAPESGRRRPPGLGRGWVGGICAALVVLAAGIGLGGYLALRDHQRNEAFAREEAAALQAAMECVAATHAPDTAAITEGQARILECSTGDFGAQAALYSGVLVDAYRAADVQVQVSDMRAAVERHNDDGSIAVLVAVRVRVSNSEMADQEQGYRLRVQMAQDDGIYKVAQLDQVTS